MKFFTDCSDYTHSGRFYGVPILLDLDDPNEPVVVGTNLITDTLLGAAFFVHNNIKEPVYQFVAYLFKKDYEPSFSFLITGKYVREPEVTPQTEEN